eukprot:TRINITY_DN8916_c0_g1_i1.p1 TRINITY_DN8916_c0_g1~~TRINITY_DN8916_c0_g1_i1.p1  ORF type:complete len:246 (-),score=48.11 TRINITY_DN8916_c0_g1_i1:62-799(-)
MPGMPGMPAGMPNPEQISAAIMQALRSAGINLPPGVSPEKAILGVAVGALVGVYILTRFVPMTLIGLVGAVAYGVAGTAQGRQGLETATARASSTLGRPVPQGAILAVICIIALIAGRSFLGGSGGAVAASPAASPMDDMNDHFNDAVQEAYQQGYEDGVAGITQRPPRPIPPMPSAGGPPPEVPSRSSGFGMGSIMKYGMAAHYIYKLGSGGPGGWNWQLAVANAKTNPMQSVILLVMLSGVIF